MKSMKPKILLAVLILLTTTGQLLFAQTKGVVVDKVSRQPISYVSIYAKIGDKVFGTVTNDKGEFSVDFTFQTLFFSHISYEKTEITKSDLKDSIYLIPTTTLLTEVVVSSRQPKWINSVLKKIVEQKNKNYQATEKAFSYKYETYTLTDSNGYAFKSNGNLLIPQLKKNSQYKIDAQKNIIKYKDKTAGTDFSNLRRMLYDDFLSNLDNNFIKDNNFILNSSFSDKNKNMVQLYFSSKKYTDYDGYLVLDTLNKVILEVERSSGTDFNIKTQTSGMLRNLISSRIGFNYNTWVTKSITKYSKVGQTYYMSDCKYKFYMKTSTQNKKVNSSYFTSMESQLSFENKIQNPVKEFKIIPKPYYLVVFYTKQMKQAEESLNKVPVSFEKF
jgi:hypothetical protein